MVTAAEKKKAAEKISYEIPENIPAARKALLERIKKEYGSEIIEPDWVHQFIRASSPSLNFALGGGYARGRIYELFGPESGGKTLLLLDAIARAQKQYPKSACAVIDAEEVFDPEWAKIQGVDLAQLDIFHPKHGDQALDVVRDCVSSGIYSIVGIDSVASLVPIEELLADLTKAKDLMAKQAKLLSTALRQLVVASHRTQTCLIFINQLRDSMAMFGDPETTPGGRALKFYASARVRVQQVGGKDARFMEGDVQVGHRVSVRIPKNKIGPPQRKAEFPVYYDSGIDWVGELTMASLKLDVISLDERNKKRGYWLGDNLLVATNKNDLAIAIRDDDDIRAVTYRMVMKALHDLHSRKSLGRLMEKTELVDKETGEIKPEEL